MRREIGWAKRTKQYTHSPGKGHGPMEGYGARRITLHTSESDPGSLQGVTNWVHSENIEYHLLIDEKLQKATQLMPFHRSARSLRNGGFNSPHGSNMSGVCNIHICVIDRAANDPFTHLSPWAKELIKAIAFSWGVPLVVIDDRRSVNSWLTKSGIAGHKNAPGNDHTDPGAIPSNFLDATVTPKPITPTTPKPKAPRKPRKDWGKVSRTLRKGNRGKAVRRLQRRFKIPVDGVFGKRTHRNVVRYQKKKGLTPDGVVGPVTWKKLGFRYKRPPSKVTKSANTRWPTDKNLMRKIKQVSADTGLHLHIVSGYRTYAEQVVLYKMYLNGTGNLAAKPGTSRHNSGKAADMGYIVNGKYRSIGYSRKARTSMRKRGLALNVPGEPWHTEVSTNWRA